MENLYYNASCPACAAFRGEAAQGFAFDQEVLKQALKTIYRQDFSPVADIEEHLFDETFATFGRAIDEGYGKPTPGAANEGFYHELRHNAAVFSAFKVHRLQNDIAAQLMGEDGQLKPFERFAEDVRPILDHQVKRWLRTEYDTAVIRAHQAADWRRYMEQAHILPNLRWLPTTSATPDIVHKQFWSIELTLPVEHPFWNAHRPGDRWNCHCSLEATDDASTPGYEIPKTIPQNRPAPGLDNNPGTDAKLFSDTHPYVAQAYKGARKAVERFIKRREQMEKQERGYNVLKEHKNGGRVLLHEAVDKAKPDYKTILTIANIFAREGKEVKITPPLHFKSEEHARIYASLKGTKYERKCPDMQIGDAFYECEGFIPPFKKEKVRRMLSHGKNQSDRLIIDNSKGCSDRFIRKAITYRTNTDPESIKEVWLYEKGKVRLFYKEGVFYKNYGNT
ncbi:hypothetical protein [Phocaeicola abscessus]|uniref:phage head morphogenesis protein n=1 Tax=Phocaeicola abscessus TaxID=555313 RepID=UPI0028E881A5|nr:hypothetical protein [Phocaeicola abscessus]